MIAIYKKELKTYFYSFIGFLFIAVNLFLLGLHSSTYNLYNASPYIRDVLHGIVLLFFITIPILTMRVLAEEKKQKTDQLILTAPVTVKDIIFGKFFALSTIFAIPTLVVCLFPLILSRFGNVPMSESYLAILGFFLYGETCIAIGIFISSLTESQVIAAVISFAVLFVGYLMRNICMLISVSGNWITRILKCFNLYEPFYDLTKGTLNLESIAYFISIILLMLFLTVQSIQKRRYTVSVKAFSIGAYSTGMIIVMVILTVVFNLGVGLLPDSIKTVDITGNQIYSLTDQTKEFVKQLNEDIDLYVLVNENQQDEQLGITLKQLDELSEHITVSYKDPVLEPTFADQYTSNDLFNNSIIVVSDKRSRVVNYSSIYASSYDRTTQTASITGYDGEGQIVSALAYVTLEDTNRLYLLEGHDEAEMTDNFKDALKKQNIAYKDLKLMQQDAVPEDAACLYINAPRKDLSKDDVNKIIAYLQRGGKVVVVLALQNETLPNLESLLDYMAVQIAPGVVLETNASNYYQYQTMLLPKIQTSNFTGSFTTGREYIFAPNSRGLKVNKENEDAANVLYNAFLVTSNEAFAKADIVDSQAVVQKGEGDVGGPLAIGLQTTKTKDGVDETMVIIACESLFTDDANDVVSGANLKLFSNIVSSFTEYKVNSIVPVKKYEVSNLIMSQAAKTVISIIITIVIPMSLLIAGFVVWFIRRKR